MQKCRPTFHRMRRVFLIYTPDPRPLTTAVQTPGQSTWRTVGSGCHVNYTFNYSIFQSKTPHVFAILSSKFHRGFRYVCFISSTIRWTRVSGETGVEGAANDCVCLMSFSRFSKDLRTVSAKVWWVGELGLVQREASSSSGMTKRLYPFLYRQDRKDWLISPGSQQVL